ncbi:MAG: UDP-N-acetylmuramate dehydrogenase [Pseudomonadales bacterium]|nr:UDP-N-acetylmuramate dehydrogenase [Pseudomonadales bacterium]
MYIIQENVSLKPFNTFQINCRARYFCEITSTAALQQLSQRLHEFKRYLILGGGSNLLFCGDYDGLLILNRIPGRKLNRSESADGAVELILGAGESWHQSVLFAVEKRLYGMENLSLIPGTVGAAPIQNIGAYGVEIKDIFKSLSAINLMTGELEHFNLERCEFGYRDSVFKQRGAHQYCVTEVTLTLAENGEIKTEYGEIDAELARRGLEKEGLTPLQMSEVICAIRRKKLPDPAERPNAGSFFKNPVVDESVHAFLKESYPELVSYPFGDKQYKLASGWLIDQLGWKGRSLNGAKVHDKQALVLINEGGGFAAIRELAIRIQNDVFEHYGVKLEPEPVWIES